MRSRWLLGGLAPLLLLLAGCATTRTTASPGGARGTIRGTLRLPPPSAGSPTAASQGGATAGAVAETPLDAIVYVEALPPGVAIPAPSLRVPQAASIPARTVADPKKTAPPATPAPSAAIPYGPLTKEQAAGAKKLAGAERKAAAERSRADRESGADARRVAPGAPKEAVEPRLRAAHPLDLRKASAAPAKTDSRKPAEAAAALSPRVTVAQVDHRFVPRVQPVALGTTVHFENRDRVWHNVFSISPAKRFDVGKYPPRQARSVTFDAPGVVQLYSDIDPSMAGFVFVSPTPVFTRPDASGAFVLPELPPGAYTLKVWHPTLGRLVRRVEVPARGDVSVSFSY